MSVKLIKDEKYVDLRDGYIHLVNHIEGAAAFCQVYTDVNLTNLVGEYSTALLDGDGSMEDYELAGSLQPLPYGK